MVVYIVLAQERNGRFLCCARKRGYYLNISGVLR